jgi:2-polyprenyl-3-methyl-5-hydroxy-6-metoxy-1,4-benzoquinol methylase
MEDQKNKIQEGSFQEWDKIWKDYSKDSIEVKDINQLFTKSTPKTIYQFWQKCYFTDISKLIDGKNYKTFLELGSGRGTTSMYLCNAGYTDITMVDLSETAFKLASQNFKNSNLPVPKMVLANVENTGLPEGAFDCIYNIGLLEHFENPEATLKEAYRLLKPGGMIFMIVKPFIPFHKSLHYRILMNPLSIAKYLLLRILPSKKNSSKKMIRTVVPKSTYLDLANQLGYYNATCISYNPYWKINKSEWIENNITLNLYKLHYKLFKRRNNPVTLKTGSINEYCFLLVGYKK